MNVSLNFSRWFELDDQVNIRNVQTTRCNVCSDQDAKFALLKPSDGAFSLTLSDVTVHNLNVLLNFVA